MSRKEHLIAVLGNPIAHSLSPKMHNFWLRECDLMGHYRAIKTDGTEVDFQNQIHDLHRLGYLGCNVTIPHKKDAFKLCDICSPQAEAMESVNTLIFKEGKVEGHNTDILGFITNLHQSIFYETTQKTQQALIIGAGGTAPSILYGLLEDGFNHITIVNRTKQRANDLKNRFIPLFPKASIVVADFEDIQDILNQQRCNSLVVNTTSVGMSGHGGWNITFSKQFLVTDVIYQPLITPFLVLAQKANIPYQNGFGMFIYQGAESFKIWTGKSPLISEELRTMLLNK